MRAGEIGGQFNVAKRVPGKGRVLRDPALLQKKLETTGVDLRLNTRVSVDDLVKGAFDEIILATGIMRAPSHPKASTMPR